jgi:septal ring factor EnvC (AmiA/AmiB activator)
VQLLALSPLFLPFVLPPAPARAQEDQDQGGDREEEINRRRDELRDLKLQIERERNEAEKLKGREKKVLGEVQAADRQLATTKRYLKKLGDQEKAIRSRLGQLDLDISARESELGRAQSRLALRVREIYKTGNPGMLEFIFSSASLPDMFDRLVFMLKLADEEKRLMESVSGTHRSLVHDRTEVERSFVELQEIEQEKQKEQRRLDNLKREREAQVASLRKKRQAHEGAAEELKEAEQRLVSLIRRLETRRKSAPEFVPPSGPFAKARGKLPWPARGQIIGRYGLHTHPQFGTATQNNGIDIQAPPGSPVRAVADGKVDYSDWLTGYGNCIILNHGGGYYTLYAHLSEVLVHGGQQVDGGALIGHSGDSGSLKGPMLHFELRRGASAMDPLGWLTR